ncbi:MAG TPA: 2-C-methyl-D-erythritol 4-phosphate cytidylyltransferase [Pyrinomonadaceae bacterium]|nr:2-C-methyl-D-erythritol 4-phosphate cytidylyltransferase [Pyrinomonadaceae bacterium]
MNTAIIVAAGSGTRFGSDIPKQFVKIAGLPLIEHTLEKFETCPSVDEIVLVLAAEEISDYRSNISKLRKVVAGGATRAQSVRNGLAVATGEIVAVHDGARPLVTVEEIERTIEMAAKTGAACLVAEVSDTIKHIEGSEIIRTVDRTKLRRALTPQAFKADILQRAFDEFGADESATDECYLVEKLGVPIACVEGSSRNIKVTRQEDLVFVEEFLRQ